MVSIVYTVTITMTENEADAVSKCLDNAILNESPSEYVELLKAVREKIL